MTKAKTLLLLTVPAALAFSTLLGEPEIIGGPTGSNFDSPFHVFNVTRPDNSSRLVGYNNNGDSYRVLDGDTMDDFVHGPSLIGGIGLPVGLNRSADPAALDHCGCWLQAVASLKSDPPGLVRGFYHEEFACNYTDNGFTNKSIAYAESVDGGVTFVKKGWPENQIILPPRGNTTATAARHQQIGEGDHSVVTVGRWMFLFFEEWDVKAGEQRGIGLARSAVASGGVPGSWSKYACATISCGFTSPGVGGNSAAMSDNMTGTVVTWRENDNKVGEFIAIGTRRQTNHTQDPGLAGHGARLSFSRPPTSNDPPLLWETAAEPLIYVDEESWSRGNESLELYAYDSVIVDPVDSRRLWFYYTYLAPGATFHERYFVRRSIDFETKETKSMSSRVVMTLWVGDHSNDYWATTAVMLPSSNYTRVAGTHVGTMLVTGGAGRVKMIDCFLPQWNDHMVGSEDECSSGQTHHLRTLGFVMSGPSPGAVPLYRCFNETTKNHAISLNAQCAGRGTTEFALGYVFP